jgi:hypothetical protein
MRAIMIAIGIVSGGSSVIHFQCNDSEMSVLFAILCFLMIWFALVLEKEN